MFGFSLAANLDLNYWNSLLIWWGLDVVWID